MPTLIFIIALLSSFGFMAVARDCLEHCCGKAVNFSFDAVLFSVKEPKKPEFRFTLPHMFIECCYPCSNDISQPPQAPNEQIPFFQSIIDTPEHQPEVLNSIDSDGEAAMHPTISRGNICIPQCCGLLLPPEDLAQLQPAIFQHDPTAYIQCCPDCHTMRRLDNLAVPHLGVLSRQASPPPQTASN